MKKKIKQIFLQLTALHFLTTLRPLKQPASAAFKYWGQFLQICLLFITKFSNKNNKKVLSLPPIVAKPQRFYKKIYQYCLLGLINLFNGLHKIESFLYILIIPLLLILVPILGIHQYVLRINSSILLNYTIPTTISYMTEYSIPEQVQYIFTNLLFPCSALLWFLLLPSLGEFLLDTTNTNTITENILLYLIKIYCHDFNQDLQEENLTIITDIENELQYEVTTISSILALYILWFNQLFDPLFNTRIFFLKRDMFHADSLFFSLYFDELFQGFKVEPRKQEWRIPRKQKHTRFLGHDGIFPDIFSVQHNYYPYNVPRFRYGSERSPYGTSEVIGYKSELFSDYIQGLWFTLAPYYSKILPYGLYFFMFIFVVLILLNIITLPYRVYTSKIYFEQFTYNHYRAYFDQYFYILYRLTRAIPKNKLSFLTHDIHASQYLDYTSIFGDKYQMTEDENEGLTFRWFGRRLHGLLAPIDIYDTLEYFITDQETETVMYNTNSELLSMEPTISYQKPLSNIYVDIFMYSLSFLFIINYFSPTQFFLFPITCNSDLIMNKIEYPPYYIWAAPHHKFNLYMFELNTNTTIILPTHEELPWLFRHLHTTPLTWLTNWSGWKYNLTELPQIFTHLKTNE